MTALRHAWSFGLVLVACGGSAPEAQAPASTPEAAAAPAAAAAAPAAADKPGADGWEGEGEAKGSAPAAEAKPAKPGASDVEETRTIEVIQKIVKERRPEVRECYEKARKDIPSLQGDVIIHFVLDPEGKVKTIELNQERSTLKSPVVTDCAIKTIKSLKFPPSSRGMETNVNYPYNFMPGGPPARQQP
ncbi:MAG TPA: AgmX/PglI C-terminal domain-containing protein [Polyangiaceae bacterium]|nr:AgmX/PglI C-terminal domain-containing protein [Polyangiaceae bacterium]